MENPNEAQAMEWESYKIKFEKSYGDPKEDKDRMKIYMENKQIIDAHNAKYELKQVTYSMAINQFSDMFPHEIKEMTTGFKASRRNPQEPRESRWDAQPNVSSNIEQAENADS